MKDMELIMENWRKYLQEQPIPPEPEPAPEPEPTTTRQKAAGLLKRVRNTLAKGFDKIDATLQDDYCTKKFPELLSAQGDIQTWGDLLATLKCGIEYKDRKKFLNILTNQIPGLNAAKEVFASANSSADFILKMYQVDDEGRPAGNMSKLDMDDHVAKMLDKDVEKEFIKHLIIIIGARNVDDNIPAEWDITKEIEEYLRKYNFGRTVDVPET